MSLKELKPREKKLLFAGAAVLFVFFIFFYHRFFGGAGGEVEDFRKISRIHDAFMTDLNQYQTMAGTVKAVEQDLDKTPPGFDLYGAMSSIVDTLALRDKVRNLSQRSGGGGNFYSESYVDMDLKQITLDDLVELLRKIQEQPAFLRVSTLSVKRRFSEERTLDVTLRISAYSKKEPEAAAPRE
jgi:type II secretory pathway component PulM